MHILELTDEEAKILALLVHLGATSFDVPAGPQHLLLQRYQAHFNVVVNTEHITSMLERTQKMVQGEKE